MLWTTSEGRAVIGRPGTTTPSLLRSDRCSTSQSFTGAAVDAELCYTYPCSTASPTAGDPNCRGLWLISVDWGVGGGLSCKGQKQV